VRGSPIRKSSDQRSVDSSPRLIAASYVLHRLLVPRHPPCALNNLATQKTPPCAPGRKLRAGLHKLLLQSQKMLASTVQFSTSNQPPATRPHQTRTPHGEHDGMRCRPALTEATTTRGQPPGPVPSGPNSVPTTPHHRRPRSTPASPKRHRPYWEPATAGGRTGQRSTLEHHPTRSAAPRE
jgi:hypothetical protein